jgi:hypothetical protein
LASSLAHKYYSLAEKTQQDNHALAHFIRESIGKKISFVIMTPDQEDGRVHRGGQISTSEGQ